MLKLIVSQTLVQIEGDFLPMSIIKKPLTYYERSYLTQATRKKQAAIAKKQKKKFFANTTVTHTKYLFEDFDNTFPTGMLYKVCRELDRANFQYEVIDNRQPNNITTMFGAKTGKYAEITPYDYQIEAIDNILFKKHGIVRIACGGGKTLVAGETIRQLEKRSVFLVNRKGLLYQTKEVFEQMLGVEIGQLGDGVVDIKDVNVVMVQSLTKYLGYKYEKFDDEDIDEDETDIDDAKNRTMIQEMLEATDVVFLDECHCIGANTAFNCLNAFVNANYRCGLSATPVREDGKTIFFEACFGEKLADISFTFLIENGFLVQPYIYMIPLEKKIMVSGKKHRYPTVYKKALVHNQLRNDIAVMEARRLWMSGHRPLLLCQHVEHGHLLNVIMPEATFLNGGHKQKERQIVLDKFNTGELKSIIATTIFDEAIDIPVCDAVIMGGGGASYVRTIQRMSRPMRLDRNNPKKDKCFIIDFVDQDKFLEKHSRIRYSTYLSEKAFKIVKYGDKLPY